MSAFIVSIAKLCGSTISIMLVDKLGRRFLLITSEILVCMSLVPLGTYFYMQEHSCLAEEYENKVLYTHDITDVAMKNTWVHFFDMNRNA